MIKKYCTRCKKYSYSSITGSRIRWLCPTCGKELTNEPELTINQEYQNIFVKPK